MSSVITGSVTKLNGTKASYSCGKQLSAKSAHVFFMLLLDVLEDFSKEEQEFLRLNIRLPGSSIHQNVDEPCNNCTVHHTFRVKQELTVQYQHL